MQVGRTTALLEVPLGGFCAGLVVQGCHRGPTGRVGQGTAALCTWVMAAAADGARGPLAALVALHSDWMHTKSQCMACMRMMSPLGMKDWAQSAGTS